MNTSIHNILDGWLEAFILWGHGWKSRQWVRSGQPCKQWRDPISGLWYALKPAMKLFKIQALDQLSLK